MKRRIGDDFWGNCKKDSNGCWNWMRAKLKGGYGIVWINGKHVMTHRYAWMLRNGNIPEGMDVLHHCDNPPCVNPDHLWLGTDRDNVLDCMAKKRRALLQGSLHPCVKLHVEDVISIRKLYASGKHPQRELAGRFGVSQWHVHKIIHKQNWAHI